MDGIHTGKILPASHAFLGFDEVSDRLWFFDGGELKLKNCNLDGTDIQPVVSGNIGSFVVNSLNQTVYFFNTVDSKFKVVDFSGGSVTEIPGLLSKEFRDIAIDTKEQ